MATQAAAYTDDSGWQLEQYLGQGEFTLEFGDWDVEITVPPRLCDAGDREC